MEIEQIKREAIALSKNHTLNAILDHLHAKGYLGGVPEWQPIETAPQKEGEVFICRDSTNPHVQFEAAWFYESEERDGAHVFTPGYYLLQNLTIDTPIDDYSDLEWMPLPAAPKGETKWK